MTPKPVLVPLFFVASSLAGALTPTITTLSSSANPSVNGHAVTITATVSPASAAGEVTFYNGQTVLGSHLVAGGLATLTTSLLPAGVQPLRAYYSGSPSYASSTSAVFKQSVAPVAANSFQPIATYSLAPLTFSMVIGDFNEDGKPDIAVSSSVNGLAILLGNGDGSFQTPVYYSAIGFGLAIGDFNQDGHTDLASGSGISLGNGDGTFGPLEPFGNFGYSPAAGLAVGDFNGDGYPDVAVVFDVGGLVIFLNENGAFPGGIISPISGTAESVIVADFNGDGRADLVIGSITSQNNLGIYLGNGDGTFQPPLTLPNAGSSYFNSVVKADLNGDGKTDLVTLADGVSVYLGNGDGTFQPPEAFGAALFPTAVSVADIDGDGTLDLVVAGLQFALPSFATVFFGNGDGTFRVGPAYSSPNELEDSATADFNGDGRTDISFAETPFNGTNLSYLNILIAAQAEQKTETTISSSPNPSTFSQNVTLSSTFLAGVGTGTITFADGDNPLSVQPATGGTATFTTNALSAGSHALVAVYGGDATNAGSTSPANQQIVNPSASTIVLLTSVNPSPYDGYLQFTANVTPNLATGTVTFFDGSKPIGKSNVGSGPVYATAVLSNPILDVGTHSITAVYSGDPNCEPSSSAPLREVIYPQSTRTDVLSSPNPSTLGQTVVISAHIEPKAATGTITFRLGPTIIGTAPLVNGYAQLSISTLAHGLHTLGAIYPGDPNHFASGSKIIQTVN